MSASDKAFIKAFAKVAPATDTAADTMPAAAVSMSSRSSAAPATVTMPREKTSGGLGERLRMLQAAQEKRPAPTVIENVYAKGSLYRIESPQAPEQHAPHFAPPESPASRRTVRRYSSRYRTSAEEAEEINDQPVGMPPGMARRVQARSLLEQARRLGGVIPSDAEALAPAIIAEDVEVEHFAAEPAPAPVVNKTVQQTVAPAPKPVVVKEVTIAATEAIDHSPTSQPIEPTKPVDEIYPATVSNFSAQVVDFSVDELTTQPVVLAGDYSSLTSSVATSQQPDLDWEQLATRARLVDLPSEEKPVASVKRESRATVSAPSTATALLGSELSDVALAAGLSAAEQESLLADVSDSDVSLELSSDKHLRIDGPAAELAGPHHEAFTKVQEEADIAEAEAQAAAEAELAEQLEAELNAKADAMAAEIEATKRAAELAAEQAAEVVAKEAAKSKQKKTCVPLWEVDRFLWPDTVQKLLKDEKSYFMQAGSKLVAAAKDGLKTLAITGSRRGEGRSTLAMCLARCAAQSGITVAIIDADFQRPQLASQIGLEIAYGWQDAATGKIPLAEAAVKSIADRVTVLPLEAAAAAAPLSLSDASVTSTFRTAADTFDLVVIDLGPLPAGEEPLFPTGEASPFDAVIVVRDLRYSTATESQSIARRLQACGVEAVGIAENYSTEV